MDNSPVDNCLNCGKLAAENKMFCCWECDHDWYQAMKDAGADDQLVAYWIQTGKGCTFAKGEI
jgi:cell fate regulator YaaT (PSP1 superfamily)